MLIEEITLVGYNRFDTREIQSFHWTPQAKLSLILGANGCGKSSLLNELNPMPPDRNDYLAGGSKRFVCSLNGERYILNSEFIRSGVHSFKQIIDGREVELNESGTVTIQKELVERILRYDNKLHALLTGQVKFTELSPPARKELLMEISPLQLDYANEIFDRTKVAARDDAGAVKHQIAKSADLESKLSSIVIVEDASSIEYLEGMVERLLPFKGSKELNEDELNNAITAIINNIEIGVSKWDKWKADVILQPHITDINSLSGTIGAMESSLTTSKETVVELTTQAMELNKVIEQIDNNNLTKEELVSQIATIEKELSRYTESYVVQSDWSAVIENIRMLSSKVEESFPSEQVFVFDHKEMEKFRDYYLDLKSRIYKHREAIADYDRKIDHLKKDSNTIICPKCTLSLSISGVDIKKEISRLTEVRNDGADYLGILEKEFDVAGVKYLQMYEYSKLYDRITSLKGSIEKLYAFWESYGSIDDVIKNKSLFLTKAISFADYVERCANYYTLKNELKIYKTALDQYEILGGNPNNTYCKVNAAIDREIIKQQYLNEQLKIHKSALAMYSHFLVVTERCEELLTTLFTTFKDWVDATIQVDASARLNAIYTKLGSIKHLVNQKTLLTKAVAEARSEIIMLKSRQADFELLQNILSPNKGIIADQMKAFINSYIEQLNKVTAQIWTHDFELKSCNMDSGTLDYKFAASKEGSNIPDISLCSVGQKEIINLAFVLVMRQYLNITDYPIYLDEPGSGFDAAHRTELMKFIKMLIDTNQCSQIFMINHYSEWHGGLSNHETVVLDGRNIVVPSPSNQNVKINAGK